MDKGGDGYEPRNRIVAYKASEGASLPQPSASDGKAERIIDATVEKGLIWQHYRSRRILQNLIDAYHETQAGERPGHISVHRYSGIIATVGCGLRSAGR